MDQAIHDKIEAFFIQYKKVAYKKGELLVRAGDNPSGIFYLKKGFVKEYVISKKGEDLVVNVFKPFAFFPMSYALNKTSNVYFFEAMTDVEVWKAPSDDVVAFIKNNPDVLFDLLSRVYRGVDGILTRMTYLMSANAYGRLITELLIYAKRFGRGQNTVNLEISEKDLAAQSGMTRETVSREMKNLKESGIIEVNNKVLTIKDVQKLEEELAGGV